MESKGVTLEWKDGRRVEVPVDCLGCSGWLQTTYEADGGHLPVSIDSSLATHDAVARAVRFMKQYKSTDPPKLAAPLPSDIMLQNTEGDEFAAALVAECTTFGELNELACAAEYLLIVPLHKLACAKIVTCTLGLGKDQLEKVLRNEQPLPQPTMERGIVKY